MYSYKIPVSAEFIEQLKQERPCFAEMADGSIIPVKVLPGGGIDEHPATVSITCKFTTNE